MKIKFTKVENLQHNQLHSYIDVYAEKTPSVWRRIVYKEKTQNVKTSLYKNKHCCFWRYLDNGTAIDILEPLYEMIDACEAQEARIERIKL